MTDDLMLFIVNLIVAINIFKVWERKLHRWNSVWCVIDIVDGKIVCNACTSPGCVNVNKVPLNVEHMVPHHCKQANGLTIVMQFIAGDDVRIAPDSTDSSCTF